MFSRPIALAMVFFLVCINFFILVAPFLIFILPFTKIGFVLTSTGLLTKILMIISFLILSGMLLYFFLDYIFGFSASFFSIRIRDYKQSQYEGLLGPAFDFVKKRFNMPHVRLLVQNSPDINAFAVGSLRKKVIIVTKALLDTLSERAQDQREVSEALKGILSHEMSHIINGDYLPGLIMHVNDRVTRTMETLFSGILYLTVRVLRFIPIIGPIIQKIISIVIRIALFVLHFFNNYILRKIYNFINIYISRSIEYRSDMDAAKACGGLSIGLGLALVGNGYNSIFSSHPGTRSRIVKIKDKKAIKSIVHPSLIIELANSLGFSFFVCATIYLGYITEIWKIIEYCMSTYDMIYHNIRHIRYNIMQIYGILRNMIDSLI